MLQEPAIGDFVFPPYISGVLPQQPDLIVGVPCVPERVAEVLAWTCLGFHSLQKYNFPTLTTEKSHFQEPRFFFFLVRSRCAEAFSLLLTGPQLLFYSHSHCLHGQSNQLPTWTKENKAMWPVRVRAQSLQRLNGPADQKGRLSSLKTSALKRAAWQLPALAIWTAVANNREQQLGSRADGQCSGLAYAWYADLARGQHMAGRHSQAAVSTVSLARSHHQYL